MIISSADLSPNIEPSSIWNKACFGKLLMRLLLCLLCRIVLCFAVHFVSQGQMSHPPADLSRTVSLMSEIVATGLAADGRQGSGPYRTHVGMVNPCTCRLHFCIDLLVDIIDLGSNIFLSIKNILWPQQEDISKTIDKPPHSIPLHSDMAFSILCYISM